MAKKTTLRQLAKKTPRLTEEETRATKGGVRDIPSAGVGSFGFITWDTIDIRTPHLGTQQRLPKLSPFDQADS